MSAERVDDKCCRCGQEIEYTGDVIDVFENNLIYWDCWETDDNEEAWYYFEYNTIPLDKDYA